METELLVVGAHPHQTLKNCKKSLTILMYLWIIVSPQEVLLFDDDPVSLEVIDSILSAMQIGIEMAKKK